MSGRGLRRQMTRVRIFFDSTPRVWVFDLKLSYISQSEQVLAIIKLRKLELATSKQKKVR